MARRGRVRADRQGPRRPDELDVGAGLRTRRAAPTPRDRGRQRVSCPGTAQLHDCVPPDGDETGCGALDDVADDRSHERWRPVAPGPALASTPGAPQAWNGAPGSPPLPVASVSY